MAGLGDVVTVDARPIVIGGQGDGLPINGQLPADAPPIATLSAYQGYLELGATPYHLVTRRKQDDGFEVRIQTKRSDPPVLVRDGVYLTQVK